MLLEAGPKRRPRASAGGDEAAAAAALAADPETTMKGALSDLDEMATGGEQWLLSQRHVRERPLWMLYEDQLPSKGGAADEDAGDLQPREVIIIQNEFF